jgi:hypothetical protein
MWRGGLGGAYPLPALSYAGASLAPPCSVSTPRSSNRTCGFAASGSPTGFTDRPTETPDSAPFVGPYSSFRDRRTVGLGLLDLAANPQAVGRFHSAPEVRPLPSTGITRLPRYYEPVRHPSAARPVPRGRPVGNAIVPPLGLPVLPVDSPCTHAIATTPAGPVERVARCSTSGGLPHRSGRSAPALRVSRSARRSLTLWPACSLTPERGHFPECFSPSRYLLEPLQVLPVGATSYRAGFAPARIDTPFTAH